MAATVRLAGSAGARPDPGRFVTRRPLTNTELAAPGAVSLHLREAPSQRPLAVALALQRRTVRRSYPTATEVAAQHGADPGDVAAVRRWAAGAGLQVRARTPGQTVLDLSGSLGALARAFDVRLDRCRSRDLRSGAAAVYRDHDGELSLPAHLESAVTAALGLSTRPLARPRLAMLPRGAEPRCGYAPEEVARLYDFPVLEGGGEGLRFLVGVAELGGAVHRPDVALAAGRNPRLRVLEEPVLGWGPLSDPSGPDLEVALDWQVIAGALAYSAPLAAVDIVIKYAPNTERGFSLLETSFAMDGRDYLAVSTSWGAGEDLWTPMAMSAMDRAFQLGALRGIPHTVASGDNGSTDARADGHQHADHPASAPHAVGCGGTRLLASGGRRLSEVAWNELGAGQGATGGGVSAHFAVPRFQASAGIHPVAADTGVPGRGVPDVAGNADPLTGYVVHHRGADRVVGGTSAVAPLWAALLAATSAQLGQRLGDVLPALYACRDRGFTDVVSGGNGAYPARSGWDPATGLGVPAGRDLAGALAATLGVEGGALRRAPLEREGMALETG